MKIGVLSFTALFLAYLAGIAAMLGQWPLVLLSAFAASAFHLAALSALRADVTETVLHDVLKLENLLTLGESDV